MITEKTIVDLKADTDKTVHILQTIQWHGNNATEALHAFNFLASVDNPGLLSTVSLHGVLEGSGHARNYHIAVGSEFGHISVETKEALKKFLQLLCEDHVCAARMKKMSLGDVGQQEK